MEQLQRGLRWARKDKPLLRALAALIRLENNLAQPRLGAIVASLASSPAREGYGRYLLGMIAYHMGDSRQAMVHLRAFLRRHASSSPAQLTTLRFEMQQAKAIVSRSESE